MSPRQTGVTFGSPDADDVTRSSLLRNAPDTASSRQVVLRNVRVPSLRAPLQSSAGHSAAYHESVGKATLQRGGFDSGSHLRCST